MRIIGIDPGIHGGLADISETHSVVVPLAQGTAALWDQLSDFLQQPADMVILEKQWARPGQMDWTLAQAYGSILMALHTFALPVHEVAPMTWMKKAWPDGRALPYDDVKAKDRTVKMNQERSKRKKEYSIALASDMYPTCAHLFKTIGPRGGITLHDGFAEALLIARIGSLCVKQD